MTNCPVIVIGAGDHARVLLDVLLVSGAQLLGLVDANIALAGNAIRGVPILGDDGIVFGYDPEHILLVNGIGSSRSTDLRRSVYDRFIAAGYRFVHAIHPSAVMSSTVALKPGVQIMAGAVIQPDALIEENVLVNTGVIIDHDCKIGAHVHLAPGVTLSGSVTVGAGSHIGTGATVIQGVQIGSGVLVAAGAVVVEDIRDGQHVMGVPAREVVS
ncbi:MAG: acetyltransferase [Nitrospira sp.]|nr:acetyltransferase [Nitrospira sp.]